MPRGAGTAVRGLTVIRRLAPAAVGAALGLGVLGSCGYFVRDVSIFYMKADAALDGKNIKIEIARSFVEKYKDTVAISTLMTVDKAMKKPNSRLMDGDLHFAGRAPAIGLPTVAEIANAASAQNAVDLVRRLDGTGRRVKIEGVWRIWAEHAGRAKEEQGEDLDPDSSENPGHVFEIHPVMKIDDIKLSETFRTIRGFKPGGARKTFGIYQNVGCKITVKPGVISFVTRKGVDNNVEFILEVVDGRQVRVEGGRFVMAAARDLDGDLLVDRLRMVFADDTPPERAVRRLRRGGRLHVYGLPRISLSEIWRRVKDAARDPSLLDRPLPYEIIIQGIYTDQK